MIKRKLTKHELEQMAAMMATETSDEQIAEVFGVSGAAVYYRRKQFAIVGVRDPDVVRQEGGKKSHATRLLAGTALAGREKIEGFPDPRDEMSKYMKYSANKKPEHERHGPMVERACIICRDPYETDQPRQVHKCPKCRNSADPEAVEAFGSFIVYA